MASLNQKRILSIQLVNLGTDGFFGTGDDIVTVDPTGRGLRRDAGLQQVAVAFPPVMNVCTPFF